MSDRRRDLRPLIERLVPDVFAGENRSPTMSTFVRGVTTGALVGAAIAGSALLTRYRRQRSDDVVTLTTTGPTALDGGVPPSPRDAAGDPATVADPRAG
jgi:hypothetical protein